MKHVMLEEDTVDVSRIFSLECFQEWLSIKKKQPKNPYEAYRKTITGHVRGDRGLEPFPPAVEIEIIKLLQERKVWPCFEGTGLKIGERGFQSIGYWQQKRESLDFSLKRKRIHCDCWLEKYFNFDFCKPKLFTETQLTEFTEQVIPTEFNEIEFSNMLNL